MRSLKHILWLFAVFFLSNWGYAQVNKMVHAGEVFRILSGTEVHVKGSFESAVTDPAYFVGNKSDVYISDSVINTGVAEFFGANFGTVHLNGTIGQYVVGTDTILFNDVEVNNTGDTVTLYQVVTRVTDTMLMTTGNVNLEYGEVALGATGTLVDEDNSKRIMGFFGELTVEKAFPSSVTQSDISGIGFDAEFQGSPGVIRIVRINAPQSTPSNGAIARFYRIIPTTSSGEIHNPGTEYFDNNELAGQNEDSLTIYTSQTNGNTWRDKGGVRNTTTDRVDATNNLNWQMDKASPFYTLITLAEDSCEVLPYLSIDRDTLPLCSGASVWVVANGATGMETYWSSGETDQDSIEVFSMGEYVVSIIDARGCVNKDTVQIVNSINPVAEFSYNLSGVCDGDTSFFTNTSSNPIPGELFYSWDFGDLYNDGSDTSTLIDPSYLYSDQGTYTVSLTANSYLGCKNTVTHNVVIHPIPVADFVFPPACEDSLVYFTNNSTVSPGFINTNVWDFGDGNTSTQVAPSHGYAGQGAYDVTLIVTANSCKDTLVKTVTIYPNPIADFTSTSDCPGEMIYFTNNSTVSAGTMTYSWNFGGSNSSLTNPSISFTNQGTYPVSLTATSDIGCTNTFIGNVTIYDLPEPSFTISNACQDQNVSFTNTSTIPSGTMTYNWDFGDGNSSVLTDPTNVYTSDGNFNATLTATSNFGCIASMTENVTVYPLPIANFSASSDCINDVVNFTNTSAISNGGMTYEWDMANGNTYTQTNVSQSYSTVGAMDVQLIATSNLGCKDTVVNTIDIYPLPVIGFSDSVATCGSSYSLDAQNPGGTYFWSTGDNTQTSDATYNGTYWVQVTSSDGCLNSDTIHVTLNTAVVPDLGTDATFCDSVVLDADYNNADYMWSTGSTNQTITVFTSGNYVVAVTDQNGCIGTDDINVVITTSTPVDLGFDVEDCIGATVVLDAQNPGNTYQWSDGSSNQTLSVTTDGDYSVAMTNVNGCVSYDTINVLFHPLPVVDLGPDTEYCDSVVLIATNSGATYNWSDGSTNDRLTVSASGQYWVDVTVGSTGCMDRDTVNLVINVGPSIDLGNDTVICSYNNITLDATSNNANYLWSQGSNTPTLTVASSGTYWVEVTDINGCQQSDTINITQNPILLVDLGEDYYLCQGATTTLYSGKNNGSFAWSNNLGIIGNNSTQEVSEDGVYYLEYTDQYGCIANDTIVLLPSNLSLFAVYLAQTDVVVGDTMSFINLSYPTPFTSYWNFDDGAEFYDSTDVINHVFFTPGDYNVTLAVSNGTCTDTLVKVITISPQKSGSIQPENDWKFNEIITASIYPNPNNGEFTLKVDLLKEDDVEIMMFNIMGQLIKTEKVTGKEIIRNYSYSSLRTGMYLVRIRVRHQVEVVKFIKI